MTSGDHLLRRILEDPADTTVRLIYADWLEEHGQEERAEFIRLQIRLLGWERARELLDSYGRDWSPALCGEGVARSVGGFVYTFYRGFVEEVACETADWLVHGPAVVACQPVLRVTLTDKRSGQPFVHLDTGARQGWYWAEGEQEDEPPWRLPECLMARLHPRPPQRVYDSEAEANAALSHACLAWAREQAGLPPLPY